MRWLRGIASPRRLLLIVAGLLLALALALVLAGHLPVVAADRSSAGRNPG